MKTMFILAATYLAAVACAWFFSGSVLAPFTAVPIAVAGGWYAGTR